MPDGNKILNVVGFSIGLIYILLNISFIFGEIIPDLLAGTAKPPLLFHAIFLTGSAGFFISITNRKKDASREFLSGISIARYLTADNNFADIKIVPVLSLAGIFNSVKS